MSGSENQRGVERVVVTVQSHDSGGIIYGEPVKVVGEGDVVVAERETDLLGTAYFDLGPGDYEVRIQSTIIFGLKRHVRVPSPDVERHIYFGV